MSALTSAQRRMNSVAAAPRRAVGWPLALICAAQFVLQLDFSIVNVALPSIQRELHVTPASLQWLITGYALTFGSLLLTGGRIGDLTGHRRLLLAGLVLFGLTSLAAGLATSFVVLVVARFAQGASAALVAPSALAVLTGMYREGPPRTRALGIFQAATAGGATAGIVLGGLLVSYIGWRAIFLVNPPIIVVLAVAVPRLLPRDAGQGRTRLDVAGAALVTLSVISLIYGLSEGEDHGFTAPPAVAAFALSVLLGCLFARAERRAAAPMLPFAIFTDPARRAALAAMLLMGGVLAGYLYFISLYLQDSLGFSALKAGLALVPATATVMATSMFLTRRLLPKLGVKRMLLLGLAAMGLGQAWLSQITASGSYEVNVLGGVMLTAFGLGVAFPTVSIAVTAGIQARQQGVAGGLFVTAQQVGAAAGLAVLATVADARTHAAHGSVVAGYRLSFLVAVGLITAAAAIVLVQLRRTTAKPPPAVPGRPAGQPAASAAIPPPPAAPPRLAAPGATGPEPADRCPLARCGFGGDVHVPGHDTPAGRAPAAH
ncbi:MAG TPA: MFS transporter [Streptosporangiaceae bacterium]|nr:MFS transporter [Streptosporangiaceae bacterium]